MLAFTARRLLQLVVALLVATGVVFVALYIAVDPVRTILPLGTSDEIVERTRVALGFNDPLYVQYLRYLGGLLQGDFGQSVSLRRDALDVTLERLPMTAALIVPASVLGVGLGMFFGMLAGMRPGSRLDNAINVLSFGGLSIAEFWLGIMLITVFAVWLGWLPSGGYTSPAGLVLPLVVLLIRPLAQTAQVMREAVVEESRKDYTMTARSKGLRESQVALRHWLRNTSIPVVTLGFYTAGKQFVGAAVAIEVIFSWPGIGRLAVDALSRGDIFLAQAVVVVAVVVVVAFNFIADTLYFLLDPRTRVQVSA